MTPPAHWAVIMADGITVAGGYCWCDDGHHRIGEKPEGAEDPEPAEVSHAKPEDFPDDIRVWYPLFDHEVTITMSKEQLVLVVEALRGNRWQRPDWYEHIADSLTGGR